MDQVTQQNAALVQQAADNARALERESEALQAAVQMTKMMWQRLEFGSLPLVSQQELIEIVKENSSISSATKNVTQRISAGVSKRTHNKVS